MLEIQYKIENIARAFSEIEGVMAIAVSGSAAKGIIDAYSDLDIFVYSENPIVLNLRREIAARFSKGFDTGDYFNEEADYWIEEETGLSVGIIYRSPLQMLERIRSILVRYEARLGYTTCAWDNLINSHPIFDPIFWYRDLQKSSLVPYPNGLQSAIINKNHKALKGIDRSFFWQLKQSLARNDLVGANHRITAILASYFDIIFAANKRTHPGDRRLIELAKERCEMLPNNFEIDVKELVISMSGFPDMILDKASVLLDNLDKFLGKYDLLPKKPELL